MARREKRRQRLICLVALASAASAAPSMSLSSFQLITSSSIPIPCILAYNTPLSGCTTDDFTRGQSCSATCLQSIERLQTSLAGACAGVTSTNTILEQALSGHLVDLLCPAAVAQSVTSNSQTSTDNNSAPPTTTTSRNPAPNPVTTQPPAPSDPTESSPPAQPTQSSSTNLPPDSSSLSPPSSSSPPQPSSSSETSQPRPSQPQSTGSRQTDRPASDSGGGSPFDGVQAAVATGLRQTVPKWLGLVVAGVIAAGL